jgi:hypothetical protein
VRTRSTGVISDSRVRIGLILSVDPTHARAAPTLPPRRRNSNVSTQNHIFSAARVAWARRTTPSTSTSSRAATAAARTTQPNPPQAVAESRTSMRPGLPSSSSAALAARADS